jgi:hypothetical protein
MTHPARRSGAIDAFAHNRPRLALLWAAVTHDGDLRAKALYRMGALGWFQVLFGKYLSLAVLLLILIVVARGG